MLLAIDTLCQSTSSGLQLIGRLIYVFKIFLPLILIALGIFDLGKAAISSKTDDVKKNIKNFFYKLAICLIVFFIPNLCMIVFGFVESFNDMKDNSGVDFDVCYACVFKPNSDTCIDAVELEEMEND